MSCTTTKNHSADFDATSAAERRRRRVAALLPMVLGFLGSCVVGGWGSLTAAAPPDATHEEEPSPRGGSQNPPGQPLADACNAASRDVVERRPTREGDGLVHAAHRATPGQQRPPLALWRGRTLPPLGSAGEDPATLLRAPRAPPHATSM